MSDGAGAVSRASRWGVVGLVSLLGCASTVEGATAAGDGGVADVAAADGGAAVPAGDGGACVDWALTDEETGTAAEPYTDDHRTFDAAGRLLRREGHIRTGGHGIDRTAFVQRYEWSEGRLVVTSNAPVETRATYALDGASFAERTVEMVSPAQRTVVRYTRDATGRVVERLETRDSPASETRCRYTYDASGRLAESDCSDGALDRYLWSGDHPVRHDRTWQGRYPGFDTWQWNAAGTLRSEHHDDGYGPGRGYQLDHTWDAQGRLIRTESSSDGAPTPRVSATFAYDAQGRLAREERGFDDAGVARSVVLWERDAQGRVSRRVASDADGALEYAYVVTPTQIEVTQSSGEYRTWRRYRCLAAPAQLGPADPQPGVRLPSTNPQVEPYPVTREIP